MSPPVQRGLPDIARDVIRGPRRRPQDRPTWRPPWLGRKTIYRTLGRSGEELTQRRDYDLRPAPLPPRAVVLPFPTPIRPTRPIGEWLRERPLEGGPT